jgi:hypothetical protein
VTGSTRRRLLALAALTLVLVVLLVVRPGGGRPAGTPAQPSNPAGRTDASGASQGVTDVRLELLQAERVPLDEADRNPFRFEAKAPPAPPPRQATAPPRDFTQPPPVVASGPPPPPPIPVRYIGFAETTDGTGRVAFFADGRGSQFQGRENDVIEGRYKILRIGPESVELAYLDGRGRQTIRLQGQ